MSQPQEFRRRQMLHMNQVVEHLATRVSRSLPSKTTGIHEDVQKVVHACLIRLMMESLAQIQRRAFTVPGGKKPARSCALMVLAMAT